LRAERVNPLFTEGIKDNFRLLKCFRPLIAAGASPFVLKQKGPKIQDGKNLLPTWPTPGPVFRRAFTLWNIVL